MSVALRTIAVIMVLAAAAAGCRSATGSGSIDDATITASVKTRLVADRASNLTRVDVDTNDGTVYLNGTVDSAGQKSRAELLAWQAKGVKSVVNNLQVHQR